MIFGELPIEADPRVTATLTKCLYCVSGREMLKETYSSEGVRFLSCKTCRRVYVVPERRTISLRA